MRSQNDILKIYKIVKQAGLGELSLDCQSPSQRVKFQIMLNVAAALVFLTLTGAGKHPLSLGVSPVIELVAGVFLMLIHSYYYQLCQQQFYQIYLAKYYTLQPRK